jgi:predicted phosphodiesterase
MKLAVASDLHLELGSIKLNNEENANVLVLAGDIVEAANIPKYMEFFLNCSRQFETVIYLMGNHEHYGCSFYETRNVVKDYLRNLNNIHVLNNSRIDLGEVVLFAGTMWTDLNKGHPITPLVVKKSISDYREIQDFNVVAHLFAHNKFLNSLQNFLDWHKECANEKKVVIATHHSPCLLSIAERYKQDYHVNGAFHSDLSEIFEAHSEISLWIHGHTHDEFDYTFFNSKIVCNPRGYFGHEKGANNFKLKYVEI